MVYLSIFLGVVGLPMQKRCLRWWRDGLCGGRGLDDLLKENITN
jgi:hypothetical protein